MTLGERLKLARTQKGFVMTDVVEMLGVSQSYLSKIERGKRSNPSLDLIDNLAKLYEVDLKWLLFGFDNELYEKVVKLDEKRARLFMLIDEVDDDLAEELLHIVEAVVGEREE